MFCGLRLFFAICFGAAVLCVVTVYYPLAGVILFLAGLLVLLSLWKGISARRFSLGLFLLSLVIHLGAVAFLTTPIESDFALQYEASRQFAQGDFSFQDTVYFQKWGYQTGLVIWQGTLLKLWDSPTFLRLVNCLVSAGTNVLVYLIARDYFEERAARLASLAYAFFLFPATLVTVLCNNIPSAFFLYLCLYLVMGKGFKRCHRVLIYTLAGASLAVANALRLLNLPEDIQQMLENGEITAGHARTLLSFKTEEGMRLGAKKSKEGASVRELEALAKRLNEEKEGPVKAPRKNQYYEEAQLAVGEYLNRKVKVAGSKKKGTLQIEFYGEEDLQNLLHDLHMN